MKGLTDHITECNWGDVLTNMFVLSDDVHQELDKCYIPNRKHTPKGEPEVGDSEVITISLFGEMVFAGAEDKTLHFIRQYHLDLFPKLLSNNRFNRRKQALAETMEAIRCYLRDQWRVQPPLEKEVAHLRLVAQCVPTRVVHAVRVLILTGVTNGLGSVPAGKRNSLAHAVT